MAATRTTKKTRKLPRRHAVRAELFNVELARARSSLKLSIYARQEKIGEVHIGRGSIFWWGPKRKLSKRISWSRFAAMMDNLADDG
jgi:hypothetical protein